VVSLREQSEKQEEEWYNIPLETLSELTQVYSKKDTSCVTGKWWPNSVLIKKCVSFTAVAIIFAHPLYMLPRYISWGNWINYS